MLSRVTTTGTNSWLGVLNRVAVALGVLPWSIAHTASAAAPAGTSLGLEIVLYWSPEMMYGSPASMASFPLTGGTGFTPLALKAAIAPPAVPSLAAATPRILFPNRVICPATHDCALAGVQSGTSYSANVLYFPVAIPSWMPFLIKPAAASVGEPLTSSTPPLAGETPVSAMCLTRDAAMREPIFSLSYET